MTSQIKRLGEALEKEQRAATESKTRAEEASTNLVELRQELQFLHRQLLVAQDSNVRLREDRETICGELRTQLASLGHLTQQGGNMVLTLASDILFDFNSFELRPSARENLAKLAVIRTLLFPGVTVRYEGHTDRVGDDNYNEWLSEQRALVVYLYFLNEAAEFKAADDSQESDDPYRQVVRKLLAMNHASSRRGATREELLAQLGDTVVGKGETEPVEDSDGASELNRRVVLLFSAAQLRQMTSLCEDSPALAREVPDFALGFDGEAGEPNPHSNRDETLSHLPIRLSRERQSEGR